jgi:hypothetical protein
MCDITDFDTNELQIRSEYDYEGDDYRFVAKERK